jgi:hypothetical protein
MFLELLFKHLFKAIMSNLEEEQISLATAANIVDITGRLWSRLDHSLLNDRQHSWHSRQCIVFDFCSSLPQAKGWIAVVFATGLLTGSHKYVHAWFQSQGPDWVYSTLDSLVHLSAEEHDRWDANTISTVAGLLNTLLYIIKLLLRIYTFLYC